MEENHVTGMKENHAAKRAMISQPITVKAAIQQLAPDADIDALLAECEEK